MHCPYCGVVNSRVCDSRATADAIRRRRECMTCGARFTTYERIEHQLPRVIKRDGRREAFDRAKIERGLLSACQKRPVASAAIDRLIDEVVLELERSSDVEVRSEYIGGLIMSRLRNLDAVAYIRFASVYLAFGDVHQFISAVKDIDLSKTKRKH